jgi:hypothetical protein
MTRKQEIVIWAYEPRAISDLHEFWSQLGVIKGTMMTPYLSFIERGRRFADALFLKCPCCEVESVARRRAYEGQQVHGRADYRDFERGPRRRIYASGTGQNFVSKS